MDQIISVTSTMWAVRRRMVRFKRKYGKATNLVILALVVHLLVFQASLDLYFSSPIEHGMTPIKSTRNPPAKRVVFVVADGLRARALFEGDGPEKAPFLISTCNTRGSWGQSQTRVPTESRPGHVALLGGIYEDPSAILQGWSDNPVYFDTVLNQSTNSWSWGSPDILNLFNKDERPHMHTHSYLKEFLDFSNENTTALDEWVFEEVEDFLKVYKDCEMCNGVKDSGNIFFLHLCGIDTAGHGFKPHSEQYKDNIKYVDTRLSQLESLFEQTFKDNATAYVVTADHGMTDWGSHGSGTDDETVTPFIAWGAGISVSRQPKDLKQVDIAPLLSGLIGINYPVNSLGRFPHTYIEADEATKCELLISNLKQLLVLMETKKKHYVDYSFDFEPYESDHINERNYREAIRTMEEIARKEGLQNLLPHYNEFYDYLTTAIDYYQNYYYWPILKSITVGMILWIIFLASYNIDNDVVYQYFRQPRTAVIIWFEVTIFGLVYANTFYFCYAQNMTVIQHMYFFFPGLIGHLLARRYNEVHYAIKCFMAYGWVWSLLHCVFYLIGLRLLVAGFLERYFFAIVIIMTGIVNLFFDKVHRMVPLHQKVYWVLLCFLLAAFCVGPVMDPATSYTQYAVSCLCCILASQLLNFYQSRMQFLDPDAVNNVWTQKLCIYLAVLYFVLAEDGRVGPESDINMIVLWSIISYPILLIWFTSTDVFLRITAVFVGFAPFYLLVTFKAEGAFLAIYAVLMIDWLFMESRTCGFETLFYIKFDDFFEPSREVQPDDFRRSFLFLVFILVGFFGTGNLASISSFDPMWVRHFFTVFAPFKMATMILLRISVPFMVAVVTFRAINRYRRAITAHMFCIVLMFADIMLLELFWYITNTGSWLEIGMSFSSFVIMEAFVLILIILYGISYLMCHIDFERSPHALLVDLFMR